MIELKLTKLEETTKTITLGWTPVPNCIGYVLYQDGVRKSNSWDSLKSSWKTNKANEIKIVAVGVTAEGVWPPVVVEPPPPIVKPVWDGRATRLSFLPVSGASELANPSVPTPNDIWPTASYKNQDFTLVTDSRFGQVFRVRINKDSKNPWRVPPVATDPNSFQEPDSCSAELTSGGIVNGKEMKRIITPGQIDWFADSFKLQTGFSGERFCVLTQWGYPTLTSPPIAFAADSRGVGIDIDGGVLTQEGHPGWWGGTHSERVRWTTISDIEGFWYDVVLGVRWVTDNTGWIVCATRCKNKGEEGFTVRYSKTSIPTFQIMPGATKWNIVMDKLGLYTSYHTGSAPPNNWENVAFIRGMTRHTSRSDAEASFN